MQNVLKRRLIVPVFYLWCYTLLIIFVQHSRVHPVDYLDCLGMDLGVIWEEFGLDSG